MDVKRLETISYAEGFVENFLQGALKEDENTDPKLANEYREVWNAWLMVSTGLRDLRRENAMSTIKINAVKLALMS